VKKFNLNKWEKHGWPNRRLAGSEGFLPRLTMTGDVVPAKWGSGSSGGGGNIYEAGRATEVRFVTLGGGHPDGIAAKQKKPGDRFSGQSH